MNGASRRRPGRTTPQPRLGHDDLDDAPASASPAPLRTRRAKSVLLIDDDEKTRAAAVAELERASVPVRAFAEGQAGLQAIASERPDIIALELDLRGAMAGKDVINMIKATMEWVDIPIVLYTRAAVENQTRGPHRARSRRVRLEERGSGGARSTLRRPLPQGLTIARPRLVLATPRAHSR